MVAIGSRYSLLLGGGLVVVCAVLGLAWQQGAGSESRRGASTAAPGAPPPGVVPAPPPERTLRAQASGPNILLITIDTLRADHLPAYGYARKTSPFLSSLAAGGQRFVHAYATSAWTAPSMASLHTSLYPGVHGVTTGSAKRGRVVRQQVLPKQLPRLAARLRKVGYRTFGVVANGHLTRRFGFARGFNYYRCVGFRPLRAVRRTVHEWLPKLQSGSKPWFLWLHLFDPHAAYNRREPFFAQHWPPDQRRFPELARLDIRPLRKRTLTPEKLEYLKLLYDSEIHHADRFVAWLWQRLPNPEQALTIVSSDHGEEFHDHLGEPTASTRAGLGHGWTLYQEMIAIPLIMHWKGTIPPGRVVNTPVSMLDVMPTILRAAGAGIPFGVQGLVLPLAKDEPPPKERPLFAENSKHGEVRAVVQGSMKLIRYPNTPAHNALFELATDPQEHRNMLALRPLMAKQLGALLDTYEARRRPRSEPANVQLSPEEQARLRALDYLQ
ncbi:MAG: sulfatase [Proteobacteria bacterium]|nr:sulfatase [Pseudomonadota bacterium]